MIKTFFFNMNAIKSGQVAAAGTCRAGSRAKVGILGAGMMGGGIAHAQASARHRHAC